MSIYQHHFAACPHCGGESGSRIDHLYREQLPCSFGPWPCDLCGKDFKGIVIAPGEVKLEPVKWGRQRSRQMVLLKYAAADRTTFFVMDHPRYNEDGKRESDEKNQEYVRYFFESHSCPTNWLSECVAVIENGDPDPHGFLTFVRAVDVPQDFDDDDDAWATLFPEAFPTANES